jgi:hypothetical protein
VADERLRELERRWRETGAPADEAALLLERVRAGTLKQERLELASWCGHAAATLATGIELPRQQKLTVWAVDIVRRTDDRTAVLIARAAAGRAVLGVPDAAPQAEPLLALVDAWLATSSPAAGREAAQRYDVLELRRGTPRELAHSAAGLAAYEVVRVAHRAGVTGLPRWATAGVNQRTVVDGVAERAMRALTQPGLISSSRAAALVREAIAAAVVREALA